MSNKSRGKQQYQPTKSQRNPIDGGTLAMQHMEAFSYSGPLPPAEDLQKYENACSGAAERIISMAEKQAIHRQELEREAQALNRIIISNHSRDSLLGILSAFMLCALCLVFSYLVIKSDKAVAGTVLGAAGITSLVSTFIYGTRANNKRREKLDK
jgi:uncharacterized membrane protein